MMMDRKLGFLHSTPVQFRGQNHRALLSRRPRIIPTRPIRGSTLPVLACTADAPQVSATYFPNTSLAETILAEYQHPTPTGTAELALSNNVPLAEVSSAYGHILASSIQDDIPTSLNNQLVTQVMYESLVGPEGPNVDMAQLSRLVTRACDASTLEADPLDDSAVDELSTLYGGMLANSIRLSVLEFDAQSLTDTMKARLSDKSMPFPMEREAYDNGFTSLQNCATNVLGTASVDAADTYFKQLAENPDVTDLQGDGYIMAVLSKEPPSTQRVLHGDSIVIAARGRLLDGRFILTVEPSPTEPLEKQLENALKITISKLPPAFACAFDGMAVGETRSVFYHPYAACDILPLFLKPEQIPAQAGVIVDLSLLKIE